MFRVALLVVLTLVAAPAFAQAPYVGAAVGMDVARFDHVEFPGSGDFDASGEAVALSLSVGTPIGQSWGVELGFVYPSEIERENSQGFPTPLLAAASLVGIGADGETRRVPGAPNCRVACRVDTARFARFAIERLWPASR